MAMFFTDYYGRDTIKAMFEDAQRKGVRYMALALETMADPLAVTQYNVMFLAQDSEELVRNIRARGLKPGADQVTFDRIFDTTKDFSAQMLMPAEQTFKENMTAEAQASYGRYLEQRKAPAPAASPAPRTSFFKSLFGR